MKEALLYDKLSNNLVHCRLCNHLCKIVDGKWGLCGVRQNIKGVLYTTVYGKVIAAHVDPIEKKPLYHFLPGSRAFSIATMGCNFRCGFCQNWEISQVRSSDGASLPEEEAHVEEIVKSALRNHCQSISYTYTEPTIFFEYAYDCAKLAREKGLRNNFVTNGYMTSDAIKMIKPYLDAANIDLKFFKEELYVKICSGGLKEVLDSIKCMYENKIWVEITTLVIPGQNDDEMQLKGIAEFIASVDKNIPWHISRFFPNYNYKDLKPTSEQALKMAWELGKQAGLRYIYVGNVQGFGDDTHCHNCKKLLIKREVFSILEYNIKEGKCVYCQARIPGIFS
ncbi:MAG: AmmeMemoRadiSam system radical SAM enzyme [Candidatus Omnitrophica bacterium]|nr:AmmeMemoRadiSam system radical SAM enzyme [Candidatus Omnitrophota bacterium]